MWNGRKKRLLTRFPTLSKVKSEPVGSAWAGVGWPISAHRSMKCSWLAARFELLDAGPFLHELVGGVGAAVRHTIRARGVGPPEVTTKAIVRAGGPAARGKLGNCLPSARLKVLTSERSVRAGRCA